MRSADLRLRTSTTLWGPLQLRLVNHRQGSELGYEAGIAAYWESVNSTVEELMEGNWTPENLRAAGWRSAQACL